MAKSISRSNTDAFERIVRWGLYVVAFMPLIGIDPFFKNFLSPFHFGKVMMFRAAIEIIAVFYIFLIMSDRRFLPKPTLFFWAMTAFTVAFGLATITSINVYQSFVGTLERMGGWYTFAHFWIFVVMMMSVFRTKDDWYRFLKISVCVSLVSTLYGFLQKTNISPEIIIGGGGRTRMFGSIGNTALFAGYTIVNVIFAFLLCARPSSRTANPWLMVSTNAFLALLAFMVLLFPASVASSALAIFLILAVITVVIIAVSIPDARYLWSCIATLGVIAVLSTAVRGSVAAVVISTALFSVLCSIAAYSNPSLKPLRNVMLTIAGVLILFQVSLIAAHDTNFVRSHSILSRLSDVSTSTRTVNTRLWAWQAGLDGWNDSPKTMLLGWGPENFNVPFSVHFNPKFFSGPGAETLFDRAHNMFVEVFVTMGLVGFVSYIGMFVVLFLMLWRMYKRSADTENRLAAITLASGIVAYMIHNAFIFDTSANFLIFFTMAGLIQFLSTDRIVDAKAKPVPVSLGVPSTLRYTAVLLAGVVSAYLVYQTNFVPILANYASTRGIVASWSGDQALAISKFKQALAYDVFPIYELRHRYAQYVLENYSSFEKQKINGGETLYDAAKEVSKNFFSNLDYLPYLYVSRIYIVLGQSDPKSPFNDMALENSKKAAEIAPKFVRTYFEVGQAYLNKKDFPNAIKAFQTAVDLNPEVNISYWYLGVTQIEAGDSTAGLATMKKAIELGYEPSSENDLARLITAYAKLNDYAALVPLYEKLVTVKPSNAEYHARLAAIYVKVNNIDGAVREAHAAAKLDPSFEAEARQFVQALGRTW